MNQTDHEKRFLLISIIPQKVTKQEVQSDLDELISLVETYEGEVVKTIVQRREVHDKGNYIGKGKIEEVSQLIKEENIDAIVFNAILKPTQIYDLYTIFEKQKADIQVWDRVDLILKIFAKHANTAEARLQIELAAMRHMGPRIYGMGYELSRQGGGLGTRGIGETNTEIMKRHLKKQMKIIKDKLEKLTKNRKKLVDRRRKIGLPTVSLVGYTNAGKTSLFNTLTGKRKLVKNALFATLDSNVGKICLENASREILVSDTIGFIRNLPPQLIDAFKSTLMESIYCDLLLHVIDIADANMEEKIATVEENLKDLGLEDKPKLYVFTKVDKAKNRVRDIALENYYLFNPQFTSTVTGQGITELVDTISRKLS
ncbi:MAG: GTPase HflX [Patescibacteria group bacterium]|jgi:GTP-binding protein HflX